MAANGAEKVYARTLQQFNDKFKRFGLKPSALTPMYGLAESTVALTIPSIDSEFRVDQVDRRILEEEKRAEPNNTDGLSFVSCGKPLKGHEIRIVDENNIMLKERHVGQLQFRGPSSMQGYYHNPVATAAVMHDGWIDSGDLAYIADGELFIAGRRKDIIIKGGRNLYPLEIEELVGLTQGVRQGCVAAFGIIDEVSRSEKLIIVAETREKNKAAREAIIEHIKSSVSDTLDIVADEVVLVGMHAVPKTSSGKLQRSLCKAYYLNKQLGKKQMPAWVQVLRLGIQMLARKTLNFIKKTLRFFYTLYMGILVITTIMPLYLLVRISSFDRATVLCKKWLRFILAMSFCRFKVIHEEKIPNDQAVIFVANHASYLDAVIALALHA